MSTERELHEAQLAYSSGDFHRAGELYSTLAERGVLEAQRWLAHLYETGKGVSHDKERARYWYEKAANTGDEFACVELGRMLEEDGTPSTAKRYYSLAAEKGDLTAQYRLARMHRRYGESAISLEESRKWLEQSAQRGHVWSGTIQAHLMLKGILPGGKLGALWLGLRLMGRTIRLFITRGGAFHRDERLQR